MAKRQGKKKRGPGKGRGKPRPREERGEKGDRRQEEPSRPAPWSVPWMVEWAKTLVFAFLIFLFLRSFVVESFVISSGSMEETLLVGDFLLVNKTSLGSPIPLTPWRIPGYGEPSRGDIIVFRADHAPGLDLVKRLVGVPGDTLAMRDAVLYRDGEAVREPYVRHDPSVQDAYDSSMDWQREHLVPGTNGADYRPTRDNWGPLVIPPERYFMLGDNREHSLDSRFWGLVERRKMKGEPFLVYYSYDKNALKPFPWVTAMRPGRLGPFP